MREHFKFAIDSNNFIDLFALKDFIILVRFTNFILLLQYLNSGYLHNYR